MTLTWTASNSADFAHYTIYRSTTSGGPYTLVAGNLTSASYTDNALQNGTSYYYTVTATDLTGYESTLSLQSAATPVAATAPSSLGMIRVGDMVTITWPSTHLGWLLESQSNNLLPNNWSTVPSSAVTTFHTIQITPGSPRTFFRLKRP